MKFTIEGWRFLSQSYAIVNQFQLLEMLRRSHLDLYHREMPYLCDWQPLTGLLNPEQEQQLRSIPEPQPGQYADAVLRMHMPFDFSPASARTLGIFGLTEHGLVQKEMLQLMGVSSLQQVHKNSESLIITSSAWSRLGFIQSGATPERVVVVPLGVDTQVCKPLPEPERKALRQAFSWDDAFIFLNVSAMNNRKGICPLLKAFAAVVERHPEARLVLKGSESTYSSQASIKQAIATILTDREAAQVIDRIAYIGAEYSFAQIAQLYQAADAYVSPYLAEGFNLPVLEAIACGLPVICTAGGPTDDFTRSEFAWRIDSHKETMNINGEDRWIFRPDLDHLIELMQQTIAQSELRAIARQAGSSFVREHYTWQQVVDRLLKVLSDPDFARHSAEQFDTFSSDRRVSNRIEMNALSLSLQSLQSRVQSFPFWYHKIELPGGIVTPGGWPTQPDRFLIPNDLTGKRVLDVGAWDGYWTFEALKRGAKQVVAIDDFSDYLGRLQERDRSAWETFDLCRDAWGYSSERCQRLELSVYDVSEAILGRFDVIFCFGTLYHLRHPLLALDKLAAICDREIYVESSILDDFSPYRGGLGKGYPGKQVIMEFYPTDELHQNSTNFWSPTLACLQSLVEAAGFDRVEAWKLTETPKHLGECRGFARGLKLVDS
jgi:glycosyltransferase involved in cell wall biosynthesis/SAM-dependent methyltransferase